MESSCKWQFTKWEILTNEKLYFFFPIGHFMPCLEYEILQDSTRNIANVKPSSTYDNHYFKQGTWYRFKGSQLATSCVPQNSCGAKAPGWLNGEHPTTESGVVERQICFNFNGNCCFKNSTVKIRRCLGYYVYQFTNVLTSVPSRYCLDVPPRGKKLRSMLSQ